MKRIVCFLFFFILLSSLVQPALAAPFSDERFCSVPAVSFNAGPNTLILTGQDALVEEGQEAETVVVIGANAYIAGRVRGEVVVIGGSIYLEDPAIIEGAAVVIGGKIEKTANARVYGEQVTIGLSNLGNLWPQLGKVVGARFSYVYKFWQLLSLIFLGSIFYWLFPNALKTIAHTIDFNPGKSTLLGLLAYLLLIPASIMLVITILGIPLVPLLWLLVLIARFLGHLALSLVAGRWLAPYLKIESPELAIMLLGLIALAIVTLIPLVGTFASIFYGLVGFGAALWSRLGTSPPVAGEN